MHTNPEHPDTPESEIIPGASFHFFGTAGLSEEIKGVIVTACAFEPFAAPPNFGNIH